MKFVIIEGVRGKSNGCHSAELQNNPLLNDPNNLISLFQKNHSLVRFQRPMKV